MSKVTFVEHTFVEALLSDLYAHMHTLRGKVSDHLRLVDSIGKMFWSFLVGAFFEACARYYHKRNTNIPVNEKRYQRLQAKSVKVSKIKIVKMLTAQLL